MHTQTFSPAVALCSRSQRGRGEAEFDGNTDTKVSERLLGGRTGAETETHSGRRSVVQPALSFPERGAAWPRAGLPPLTTAFLHREVFCSCVWLFLNPRGSQPIRIPIN